MSFPFVAASFTAFLALFLFPKSLTAQLRAGAATAVTDPVEYPVSVNGGMRDRFVESANDPLHARAIALENGGSKLAICIVDLCMIPDEVVHAARKLARESTGIPEKNILIAATHTHTAPTATGVFQSDTQENYLPHLTKQIAKSIIDAHANLEPAEAGFGSHDVPQHVHNRRWLVADGESYANPFGIETDRAWMNPGFKNPKITKPAGPVDPEVSILALRALDGHPIAVLANYSLHYVGNVPALSADYFGQFATIARSIFAPVKAGEDPTDRPPFVAILSNGTSADVNNIDFSLPSAPRKAPYQQARLVANDVAQAAAKAWEEIEFSKDTRLDVSTVTLELGVRKADAEELARARKLLQIPPPKGGYIRKEEIYARESVLLDEYPDQVTAEIQAIRIGDLSIAAIPCETFTAIGLGLKEKSPFDHHFTISLANGYHGYLPTPEQHALGGYETWRARSSYLETGASPRIMKALLRMLPDLHGEEQLPPKPNPAPQPQSPEESLASIRVPDGYKAELVVAEPDVMDPVAIDWDARGRLWVVEMADYPLGLDGKGKPGGRVRVLEDADRDGKYEKNTVFLDGLPYPNGIKTWRDGVLITAAPDIHYAEDTDGDDKADKVEPWFTGFGEGNQQLRVNGLRWSIDGWLHVANGKSSGTIYAVDRPEHKIDLRGHDCRIRPDTREIEATTGVSQFGLAFDNFGERFGCDNSNLAWHVVLEDRHLKRNPHVTYPSPIHQLVTPRNPPVYPISKLKKRIHADYMANRFTSACGICIYRDSLLFPSPAVQHLFVCEPVHNVVTHRLFELVDAIPAWRADDEKTSEFIASEDNWFRPVMARTGPDGALWIVDMYRDIVEHPHWVPKEIRATWEMDADLRAGHDKGRIYRIVRTGTDLHPFPELAKCPPASLVAMLGHQNGTLRDIAQQQLVWNESENSKRLLRESLADKKIGDGARMAALGCLAHAPNPDDLKEACLKGERVIRTALRLTESLPADEPFPAFFKKFLGSTPNSYFSIEAATAMGNPRFAGQNGDLLGKMATGVHPGNSFAGYKVAAISTALPANLEPIANALAEADSPHPQLVANTLITADKMGKLASVKSLSDRVAQISEKGEFAPWQFEAAAAFGKPLPDSKNLLAAATLIAVDNTNPAGERAAAINLLGTGGGDSDALVALLEKLLTDTGTADPEVTAAVLAALARRSKPRVAEILLAAYPKLTPANRATATAALLRRTPSTKLLLESIQAGTVSPTEIDNTQRKRLLNHKDEAVKTLATTVFVRPESDRAQVVADHRDALELEADAKRGKEIFALNCAVCHQLDGVGNPIGPDLRSVTDRSPLGLLNSILDPTAQMEPIYQGYICETTTGEFHAGLIVGETGGGVEIVGMDARRHQIPGSEIKSLSGTGKSFMPEGLEAALKKQDLADLIAYLGYPE